MRVALTGGIASGKSTVSALLRSLGAVVIDADQLARDVVAPGTPGLDEVVEAFGPGVLAEDGSLDRPAVARIVFGDEEARRRLEGIIHPKVFEEFVRIEESAPADALVVHARKAWLAGLSPKENREVPPLDYPLVYALKAEMPGVPVIINGGIGSIDEARAHLEHVDGVMLGRAAYQEPWRLLDADAALFGAPPPAASMQEAIAAFIPYVERELARGTRLHAMTRHLVEIGAYTSFYEVEVARTVERFGDIAQVWSAYETRRNKSSREAIGRGLNSIQLIRERDRWSVLGLLWDEGHAHPKLDFASAFAGAIAGKGAARGQG